MCDMYRVVRKRDSAFAEGLMNEDAVGRALWLLWLMLSFQVEEREELRMYLSFLEDLSRTSMRTTRILKN